MQIVQCGRFCYIEAPETRDTFIVSLGHEVLGIEFLKDGNLGAVKGQRDVSAKEFVEELEDCGYSIQDFLRAFKETINGIQS